MINYKIEKGVPLPNREAKIIFPFKKLKVGYSFLVPKTKNISLEHARLRVYKNLCIYKMKCKDDIKITTSKQHNGIRVWRTA